MSLTLVDASRQTIAGVLNDRALCLALGTGDAGWGAAPPAVAASDAALVAPHAMLRPTVQGFVEPTPGGAITSDDGAEWAVVAGPTAYLYAQWIADFDEGALETVREWAVYFDPQFAGSVGAGQTYIPWADVTTPGALYGIERVAPIARNGLRLTIARILSI